MNPQDIERMNAFFDTHHLDKYPEGHDSALDHDPEDGDAAGIAYFTEDGRLLLMQRATDKEHGGEWSFPAGNVEEGETPEDAAVREFREETGELIGDLAVGGSTSFLDPDTGMRFTAFHVLGDEFEPLLDEEHTDYVWAMPDALPQPLHPGVIIALKGLPENKDS